MQSQTSSMPGTGRLPTWLRSRLQQRAPSSPNPEVQQLAAQQLTELAQSLGILSIKVGLPFDTFFLIWTAYAVWVEHRVPVLAFVNYFLSTSLSLVALGVLLWKRRPFTALAVSVIIHQIYLFANMWVLRNPGIFVFSLMVLLPPALVFRRRTIVLVLTVLGMVLYMLIQLTPEFQAAAISVQLIAIAGIMVGAVGIFMAIGHEIRRRLHNFAALAVAQKAEAVERGRLEEQHRANERNRIAREIHDGLGHYLTTINIHIAAARAELERDRTSAVESLDIAQTLTKEGLAETRRSVFALRPVALEHRPFIEAVRVRVAEAQAAGVETRLHILGDVRFLAPHVEWELYRAVQEGLTNVYKHAKATRTELTLDFRDATRVRLIVQDNGVGADEAAAHVGFTSLRERAAAMAGTVSLRTAPGQGFALTVEVPG